jgi:hypothetical protein
MPSVYLTKVNAGKAIPSFAQKGIANQGPGVVGEVPILVHAPSPRTPSSFLKYIFHVVATHSGHLISAIQYFNIFKPLRTLNRVFEVPPCSFRFSNLTPAEVTELKAMGLQQDLANPNLFVGTPPATLLARIDELGPMDDRIRPGHITYDAFFAWVYLMKGIQIFSTSWNSLHDGAYSIVCNPDEQIAVGGDGILPGIDGKPIAVTKVLSNLAVNGIPYLLPPVVNLSAFPGCVHDINALPQFSTAIFFPFFPGMSLADKTTSAEVFARIFNGSLSTTQKGNIELMAKVRSGVRNLAFSRTGMVLAHIYRCFSLALDIPNSRVHILTKGTAYVGFVLEGAYDVSLYGTVTASGDVKDDIAKVDLIDSQACEIAEKINAVELEDGSAPYKFVKGVFLSSRSALRAYNSLDPAVFHSSDTLDEIRNILEKMEFNDTYAPVTQETILDAVRFMSSGDYSHIQKYPAFLGGGVLHSRSKTWEALSMFGPRAPSCNTGDKNALAITFPSPDKSDTNTVRINGVRPLHYLPFWDIPLSTAVAQWDSLVSKGVLLIPKGRKGKKEFTNLHGVVVSVASEPAFQTMYDMVKGMVDDARKSGIAGNKRKRSDDDDAKGGKRKKLTSHADI